MGICFFLQQGLGTDLNPHHMSTSKLHLKILQVHVHVCVFIIIQIKVLYINKMKFTFDKLSG